jgi:nucleoside phosphorylase
MAALKTLSHDDYSIGWICPLSVEMATAKAMLDKAHAPLSQSRIDSNNYALGEIFGHNVVIACLPSGVYGATSAAVVAEQMLTTFRRIRFGLLVGIGGGIPSGKLADVRLGDLVVSNPTGRYGGVVQYDYGKTLAEGQFQLTGSLNKPPQVLLTAIAHLQSLHMLGVKRIPGILEDVTEKCPALKALFSYPGQVNDRLSEPVHRHVGSLDTCLDCDEGRRPPRPPHIPRVHYGLIASGNQVMKDGVTRDRLAMDHGILCFEMEAAGLMDHFPCLVIRGICDYADSHKNNDWQPYAAAVAAAYAKELLEIIPKEQVEETEAVPSERSESTS